MDGGRVGERNHVPPRQQAGPSYSGSKLHAVHGCWLFTVGFPDPRASLLRPDFPRNPGLFPKFPVSLLGKTFAAGYPPPVNDLRRINGLGISTRT